MILKGFTERGKGNTIACNTFIKRVLVYFVVLILVCFMALQANARQKAKNNADKTTSQAKIRKDTGSAYRVLLLPEFYHLPVKKNDTTFKYECSKNRRDVSIDTLHNINDVNEIIFSKNFYLNPDPQKSMVSPAYLSQQGYIYERSGADTWVGIDKTTLSQTDFKENKKIIVRDDTTFVTNSKTGNKEMIIHKYYKIVTIGQGHHDFKD
jgi:hypothetical protein